MLYEIPSNEIGEILKL